VGFLADDAFRRGAARSVARRDNQANGADPFPVQSFQHLLPADLGPGASAACPGLTVMSSNNLPIYPRCLLSPRRTPAIS